MMCAICSLLVSGLPMRSMSSCSLSAFLPYSGRLAVLLVSRAIMCSTCDEASKLMSRHRFWSMYSSHCSMSSSHGSCASVVISRLLSMVSRACSSSSMGSSSPSKCQPFSIEGLFSALGSGHEPATSSQIHRFSGSTPTTLPSSESLPEALMRAQASALLAPLRT